jgi:hypothetical protein
VPGQDILVRKNMINKILLILERDQDITLYEEFHYIYITLRETVSILRNGSSLQ